MIRNLSTQYQKIDRSFIFLFFFSGGGGGGGGGWRQGVYSMIQLQTPVLFVHHQENMSIKYIPP